MATLADLRVSVKKASPTEDYSTHRYHISLEFGDARWEVLKRFSEFDLLLQSLTAGRYAGLPKLPSKTMLGSPMDTAVIEARKQQLRLLLNDLLMRPDTRTSQMLRQFLTLDSHSVGAVRSLQPEAIRTFEDPRFGVSGLCVAPEAKILIVTHEDSTHLSRLGRVWSVVEPDELGALHLWTTISDGSWKRTCSNTFGIKVRCLCWEDVSKQFFVGLEDGKIEVYNLKENFMPNRVDVLELHHKNPVTHLVASSRKLLSLGFDTAMRTIDINTRELLCGGRLLKRLKNESDYLTCGCLDDANDRAYIGTSGGDVFILDVARNPPSFLHTADMGAKPVSMICASEGTLLIANSDRIAAMSLEGKGLERQTVRQHVYTSKHLLAEEVTIMSMAVAPERQLLFGGYSDGSVAIWNRAETEAFIVLQAHQCATMVLVWVPLAPWGPALLSGGGDGKVVTWCLSGSAEEYVFWTPQGVDGDDTVVVSSVVPNVIGREASGLEVFEPSWGGPSAEVFRDDNRRVNAQALKQVGESDSDDDLGSALH